MKTCPFCAEEIQDAAIKCRYCGSDLDGGPGPRQATSAKSDPALAMEKTYYSRDGIVVTSTRAMMGGKTYAMANITSVSLAEISSGAGWGCGLMAVGGVLAVALVNVDTVAVGIVGIALAGLGLWMMSQRSYVVRIGSASGEVQAFESPNRSQNEQIVRAVNQAIIERR